MKVARVKPDVNGVLRDHARRVWVPLVHGQDYDADSALVKANPDVFELVKPSRKPKPEED